MINNRHKNNRQGDPFVIKEGSIKYGRLEKVSYANKWLEDSFMPGDDNNEVIGRTFNFSKLRFIGVSLLVMLSILIGRVAWLQVAKGEYYSSLAEGNSLRLERIEAQRGVIYDRDNKALVMNVANFILYLVPIDLPREENERDVLLDKTASMIAIDQEEKKELLRSIKEDIEEVKIGSLKSYRPLFIADKIPYEKAMKLYLEAEKMPGVVLSNKNRREYLTADVLSMSHILGYTGKISPEELEKAGDDYLPIDYMGKTGIESFWEGELRGKNGKKKIEVDALGNEKKIISKIDEEDGHNLVLTIDLELQRKTEEILKNNIDNMGLEKGVVVTLDPNNGEVLSLVSLPTFDNNVFARGISSEEYGELINDPNNPLFSRAISGEYPSGSTIKPVVAQAALEEGIISENTTFLSTGGLAIGQWYFPDWKYGGHGITDVRKAISQSVNTFFYYIGGGYDDFTGLGVERLGSHFRLFGLGKQLGIDLPNEASGFVPTREWKEDTKGEMWYIGDTYHLAIGQGDLLVTPLQVANFTAVFANGGTLYRPHLVKSILNSQDNLVRKVDNYLVREDFLDDYKMQVIRQGMRETVVSGSGVRLSTLPVKAAGKTGTAQWSGTKEPHAWFTGFAPYDEPEIAITVLVEEGEEGSKIGVTIAKEILEYYFDKEEKSE
ncbi:penicillin-binding protein 2 [Candidatus Falkowbacteria bacterium]|nr:penicillin-binding protein 2 [Candidatus Falkowbacteria bacterium]